MAVCGRCGGMNLTDEVCPECGAKPRSKTMTADCQDISLIAPKLDNLRIPKAYLGKNWNTNMFWASHSGLQKNQLVATFATQCDKVHSLFASGTIPPRSAIFIAPAGYGKMTWSYSCIQYAITHGYSVAPFLDTLEIKRLFVLSAEKPNQKHLGIDYESYIDSDILFFTVTKTEYRKGAYSVIADLLDKRARRGKITLGVSRYTVYELSQWDYSNDFNQILAPDDNSDTYKVPAIVSCI